MRREAPRQSWRRAAYSSPSTTARGRLLGEAGREDDIMIPLPPLGDDSRGRQRSTLLTIVEADDLDDRHGWRFAG